MPSKKGRPMIKKLLLLLVCLSTLASAQSEHYILYSLEQDVTGDGVPERIMVRSTTSSDPSADSPKDLVICHRKGDKYVAMFRKSLGRASFYTPVEKFQWQAASTILSGVTVRPVPDDSRGYPEIWLVFAPNSGEFVTYRFNGSGYKLFRTGD